MKISIDSRLYFCYTYSMKTAVSLPDTLFEVAEQTAHYMGISRSRLFVNALEDYITRHNSETITEKINEVYEKIDTKEFEPYLNVGLEPIRKLTRNDSW